MRMGRELAEATPPPIVTKGNRVSPEGFGSTDCAEFALVERSHTPHCGSARPRRKLSPLPQTVICASDQKYTVHHARNQFGVGTAGMSFGRGITLVGFHPRFRAPRSIQEWSARVNRGLGQRHAQGTVFTVKRSWLLQPAARLPPTNRGASGRLRPPRDGFSV